MRNIWGIGVTPKLVGKESDEPSVFEVMNEAVGLRITRFDTVERPAAGASEIKIGRRLP